SAMNNIGVLHYNGQGVPQDYAKAREWFEKAADEGDTTAMNNIGVLYEHGQGVPQDYAKAREWSENAADTVQAEETTREGTAAKETAQALNNVAWYSLLAREFTKALTIADRAHALFRDNLMIEINRAHALMFVKAGEECKALYLAHKGKPLSEQDG